MTDHDPAAMRRQYRTTLLDEADLAATPMAQFARWFKEAVTGGLHEPNAMVVATATPDGHPSTRTVLLKAYDDRGFVFYTNYASRKANELAANPHVSLLFPWHQISRQVIVTGKAARIPQDETEAYFRTPPPRLPAGRLGEPPVAADRLPHRADDQLRGTGDPLPRRHRGPAPSSVGRLPDRPGDDGVLAGPREPPPRPPALCTGVPRHLAGGTPGPVVLGPWFSVLGPGHAETRGLGFLRREAGRTYRRARGSVTAGNSAGDEPALHKECDWQALARSHLTRPVGNHFRITSFSLV